MNFQDPAVDPVICSPFEEPAHHWLLDRTGRAISGAAPVPGRRESMLLSPVPDDDKSAQAQLELDDVRRNRLINEIREKVQTWRHDGYPGATRVSTQLMEHWADERGCRLRPFFAQREAIETLIWLREVATRQTPERRELEELSRLHNDGLVRHAAKMATGTGKTAVMGMLIAWQTLNAARTTRRRNLMHGERFLVLTPGLTIRNRLAELRPSSAVNVYDEMGLVPADLRETLNRARVEILNYQAFTRQDLTTMGFPRSGSKGGRAHRELIGPQPDDDAKESHQQAAERVLKSLVDGSAYGDLVVINDEAHHCYLPKTGTKRNPDDAKEDKRAAVWFNVLRSLRDMEQLGSVSDAGQASVIYDFSATPMWIDTSARAEPEPFEWVASDFGLMDAIESGLTKVPRVPVDDDSGRERTVWRRLYDNTNKKTIPKPSKDGAGCEIPAPLRNALDAQYDDYKTYLKRWQKVRPETAPTLIVVANSIDNADALYEHIAGWSETVDDAERLHPGCYPELSNVVDGRWADPPRTLVVHSDLNKEDKITAKAKKLLANRGKQFAGRSGRSADALEAVREVLNTVGKEGQAGAQIRCVISVGMLTEGWDARTVTHIVGYRAFSTQLLCEQVTGRALRRTSYEDFRDDSNRLTPEYAEVVGIPFEFMPSRPTNKTPASRDLRPRTNVHTIKDRGQHRIVWPRVREYRRVSQSTTLLLDPDKVTPWKMKPLTDASMAVLSPQIGEEKIIDVSHRRAQAVFKIAAEMVAEFRGTHPNLEGTTAALFVSAHRIVQQWLDHPNVDCPTPRELLVDDSQRRDAVVAILRACTDERSQSHERVALLDAPPTADTSSVDFWTTLKHIHVAGNSELSHAACHSKLERDVAQVLDTHQDVASWARNFQTGWAAPYHFEGSWRRYEPDFIARLSDGLNLIIECKGVRDDKAIAAEAYIRDHWIPCVAGTPALPDALRRWEYLVITDATLARSQIAAVADPSTVDDVLAVPAPA